MGSDSTPAGMTLALRAPTRVVAGIMDLSLAASGADRAALLLMEEDGTLRCHVMRERGERGTFCDADPGEDGQTDIAGIVREALAAEEPVVVATTRFRRFPPGWRRSVAARSAVLAPLATADGPLGLLLLGWDDRAPAEHERTAAATSATSIAAVLEAAIEAHVERSRALVREAAFDAGREPVAKTLAAIYLRAGLLRLVLEPELAGDADEIESLARQGLMALRRSEEQIVGGTLSADLLEALLLLTSDADASD